jgi:hypothetical protein
MATYIIDAMKDLSNTLVLGFKYNIQFLPDTLTAAALIFAILIQSPPLAAMGSTFILLNFIHPSLAEFISKAVTNTFGAESDPSLCSGHFPGVSYEKLLSMSSEKTFGSITRSVFPSYYTTFMGLLLAWIVSLPILYRKEIAASPKRKAALTLSMVILVIVMVTAIIFRITSSCDSVFGVGLGMASGLFVGTILIGFIAWISDRRLSNVLSFPLIRDKVTDGKPIYVCEKRTTN